MPSISSHAIVNLKNPSISAALAVTVVYEGTTGEIRGDIAALAKFLEVSDGAPLFDPRVGRSPIFEMRAHERADGGCYSDRVGVVIELEGLKSDLNNAR